MSASVVVTFDALELPAGRITAQHKGMAVRMYVADDILADGLEVHYEVLQAPPEAIQALEAAIQDVFKAKIRVTQTRDYVWRANVRYLNLDAIHEHDVLGTILRLRHRADRLMQVYEGGIGILRLDLAPDATEEDAQALEAEIKAHIDRPCTVRTADLGRALEDWQPLA